VQKFTKPRDSGTGSGTNNQSSGNARNTNQVISGYMLPVSSYDEEDAIQLATEEDWKFSGARTPTRSSEKNKDFTEYKKRISATMQKQAKSVFEYDIKDLSKLPSIKPSNSEVIDVKKQPSRITTNSEPDQEPEKITVICDVHEGADDLYTKPKSVIHRLNDKFRTNIKAISKSPDDAPKNRASIRKKRWDSMDELDEIFSKRKGSSPQLLIDLDLLNESQDSGIVQDFNKHKEFAGQMFSNQVSKTKEIDSVNPAHSPKSFFVSIVLLSALLMYLNLPINYLFVVVPCLLCFAVVHKEYLCELVFTGIKFFWEYLFSKTTQQFYVRKIDILSQDTVYRQRGTILDLQTKHEKPPTSINFKVYVRLEDNEAELAELDSDSHVSMICQDYFERFLKNKVSLSKYLHDEKSVHFSGMGGQKVLSII
jgi:hypothetical protein